MSTKRTPAPAPAYAQILRTCPQGRPGDIVQINGWPAARMRRYLSSGVIVRYALTSTPARCSQFWDHLGVGREQDAPTRIEQSATRPGTGMLTGHAKGIVITPAEREAQRDHGKPDHEGRATS